LTALPMTVALHLPVAEPVECAPPDASFGTMEAA